MSLYTRPKLYNFLVGLGTLSSLIVMLIWPIGLLTYITPYYTNAFTRYNVYINFKESLKPEQINSEFAGVLEFLHPLSTTSLDATYFSYEDITHMQDVRNIFRNLYIVGLISLVISGVIFMVLHRAQMGILNSLAKTRKYIQEGILVVVLSVLLFLAFWQYTFIGIHKLLFSNNNYWQLDPKTSNLIKYLPPQIFQELLVIYIAVIMIEFLIVSFVMYSQLQRKKNKLLK